MQAASTHARKDIAAYRAYNRRRWDFEKDALNMDERAPFVCECSIPECDGSLDLTMLEYESAHMCDNWCAVLPDHLPAGDESRVVTVHPNFWVIELASLEEALSRERRAVSEPAVLAHRQTDGRAR